MYPWVTPLSHAFKRRNLKEIKLIVFLVFGVTSGVVGLAQEDGKRQRLQK